MCLVAQSAMYPTVQRHPDAQPISRHTSHMPCSGQPASRDIYKHMHIYMYISMYTCICIYVYAYGYVNIYICIYIYIYIHVYTHICIFQVYLYIYTYTHSTLCATRSGLPFTRVSTGSQEEKNQILCTSQLPRSRPSARLVHIKQLCLT